MRLGAERSFEMTAPAYPFPEPETSEEEIYRATYEALKAHGLADLSIQQIAEEATLGKSTIYHHFESKRDLLTEFVAEFMEAHVDALMLELPGDDRLALFRDSLDLFVLGEMADGTSLDDLTGESMHEVYLQLRAQAATDPAYRSAMADADAIGRERMVQLAERAIEDGLFRPDVDPHRVAATLYAYVETSLLVQATSDDTDWLQDLRASADDYMAGIVADDVEWPPRSD